MGEFSLQDVLDDLDIDVPVLDIKISGDKVVLYLYGGRVIERAIAGGKQTEVIDRQALVDELGQEQDSHAKASPGALLAELEGMTMDEIRSRARSMGIKVNQRKKVDLVKELYSRLAR